MKNKPLFIMLICLALAGFSILGLQYKVTELSLELPKAEEAYLQKKQMLEKLDLELRMLKNPRALFDNNHLSLAHLVFPKEGHVIALKTVSLSQEPKHEMAKSGAMYLPLAKVFP